MPIDNNDNKAKFFFSSDGVTFNPIGDIVGNITLSDEHIQNPKCIILTPEEFTATVKLSEEADATLWATCEGLEIVPNN